MRFSCLLFTVSLFLGLLSCSDDPNDNATPLPESTLTTTIGGLEKTFQFGYRTKVERDTDGQSGSGPLQERIFLTANEVIANGQVTGTTDVLTVTFQSFSANALPVDDILVDYQNGGPQTLVDGEYVRALLDVTRGRNFATGFREDNSGAVETMISFSTDTETGLQTLLIDSETQDGRPIKGEWTGVLKNIDVTFR